VAAGSFQQPEKACGPRSWISPSATGSARRSTIPILACTSASDTPIVSPRGPAAGLETFSPFSVVPYLISGRRPSTAGSRRPPVAITETEAGVGSYGRIASPALF